LSDTNIDQDAFVSPGGRPGGWRGPALLALVLLAAGSLVVWYALQKESPAIVVQRFCSALKGQRWAEAYAQIDWPADKRMDEKSFTQTCKVLSAIATIQKYKLGEPRREGETAVVPVNATVSITGFGNTQERTDQIDIHCRLVDGKWKVRPDLKQGFLGLGKSLLPGLK
jgi:hypothetical protein